MLSPDDLTFYIILVVCIIVLFQLRSKAQAGNSPVATTVGKLSLILVGTVALLGIFYARIRAKSGLSSFDAGTIALDVVFAHLVLTLPVFLELFYVAKKVAPWVLALLSLALSPLVITFWGVVRIGALIMRWDDQDTVEAINGLLALFFLPVISLLIGEGREITQMFLAAPAFLGTCWLMWVLFVQTMDLQLFFFGAFDGSLGWDYPTTFRFTILFEHLKGIVEGFGSNEVVSTIGSFVALTISLVIGGATLIKAVQELGETYRSRREVVHHIVEQPIYRVIEQRGFVDTNIHRDQRDGQEGFSNLVGAQPGAHDQDRERSPSAYLIVALIVLILTGCALIAWAFSI